MTVRDLSPEAIEETLRGRFGLDAFRPWQKEAIEALLFGPNRVLVVAPTGGGKSLTYQLPAVLLEGTTLVLSPLVALMEDQVRSLAARGISATYFASTLEPEERSAREAAMLRGEYSIVYAAPERMASESFVRFLGRCKLALVAIDEAHCIAQWGHDFRPDYLRIGDLLRRLEPPRVLACTATATSDVRREIRTQLGFDERPFHEVLRGFARPNLHLAARTVDGPKDAKKALFSTLEATLGGPRAPKGGAIVYAATRKTTEQFADVLKAQGYNATHYHAGMDGDARTRIAERFAARKIDVIVATNAFGMGIDRPDIRAVVHVQPPSSIEAYYQEVGRAGRDGNEASGILLCSGADIALRRRLVQMGTDGEPADPASAARAWGLFRDLLRYVDARSCRHDFVLRYFGDERELLGGCGHCDICHALASASDDEKGADSEETSLVVRKALSAVARADRRAGLTAVAEMLHGVSSERTTRFGFSKLSTFGLLKDKPVPWIVALLRSLLAAGWIDLTTTEHPVPYLTRSGAQVMKGEAPALVVLPPSSSTPSFLGTKSKPPPRAEKVPLLGSVDQALFEKLRSHRAEVARTKKVPAYVVAMDRTLLEMATVRPRDAREMLSIHGMGPFRVEQYGDGFLKVLTETET